MTVSPSRKTLCDLTPGQSATILEFHGGQAVNRRLASLGFTPGVIVSTIRNNRTGPLIILVRGTQVALGRGEAKKIIVKA